MRNLTMLFKQIITMLFKLIKRYLQFSVYYTLVIDLYLLEFFSRKYPYLLFLFSFFYGTFGYTSGLSDHEYLFKISCLLFSWYLVYTSLVVFLLFKIPTTKKYLYDLLGEPFVVSKIGNPGIRSLTKYGGVAVFGLTVNEIGRITDGYAKVANANALLDKEVERINKSCSMTQEQRATAEIEALREYGKTARSPSEGTFDKLAKTESRASMVESASKTISDLWKGK